jgi:FkbM family methyltransferase
MHDELRIEVQGGATLCVPDALTNITTYVLLEQETWFEDELAFVRACLSPGECAVDVGANFGVFATALAGAVGSGGKVIAFEPAGSTAAFLRRTLDLNALAQVELVQAALSDTRGHALLEIGDSPELNALTSAPAAGRATERVELLVLDEALRSRGVRDVSVLKIDAEGHELQVGLGARGTLRESEPLVMFEIKHGDAVELRLLDALQAAGFQPYRLLPGPGLLVPFDRGEPLDDYQLNLFACTPRRADLLSARGLLARSRDRAEVGATLDEEARACLAGLPGAGDAAGEHVTALAHYALLQTAELTPAQEAAHLDAALRAAQRACSERASTARQLTYARLAADAGRRRAAVDALRELLVGLTQGKHLQLDEPCLPPHARYDALTPGADPAEWAECAVIETFERRLAFSSIFRGPPALPAMEHLRTRRYYCAEMERRRQLLRLRARLQAGPQPHPLLARRTPDNLNPGYWTGAR